MIRQKLAQASVMLSSGHRDKAEQIYREILELEAFEPGAALGLGLLLAQRGKLSEALTVFERAIANNPRDINLIVNLAILLQGANEPMRALVLYNEALAIQRDIPEVHFNRGVILRTLGQFAESLESFDQSIICGPVSHPPGTIVELSCKLWVVSPRLPIVFLELPP